MTDITFITSNQTKLAHAKYLCRNYNVNILHYKKLYYGVGYEEPRIDDPQQLLTESFNDAVARWRKYVSDDRLFFIEDTSVKIDALSSDDNEVPGVDVKYWMRETSFKELDEALKDKGNNRRCSVTSHVVLFLTKELKDVLGTKEDRVIFKSSVYGSVVEKEYEMDTQILYPWLDNKTFNKWFVPEGYTQPVSMLDISDAEAGDFRKGAFEEMLEFLKSHGAIEDKHIIARQLQIHFFDNYIICGKTCAGKSTIGRYLVDRYGYYHIEASEFMTQKMLETHGTNSGIDRHRFAAKVLETEPLFVVDKLIEYMKEHEIYDRFVITGFRTTNEVEAFLRSILSCRLQIVYINSDFVIRFKRWMLRKRDIEQYTEERFKAIDNVQEAMGIGKMEKMKGVHILDNNIDGLTTFYGGFKKQFLKAIKHDPIKINIKELESINISLERAILIALSIEFQKDEAKMFTTTEISHLINKYFKSLERSKNNVSRYFNQTFYVYYEVKNVDNRNRYKISPIGYSEAMMIINNYSHGDDKKRGNLNV